MNKKIKILLLSLLMISCISNAFNQLLNENIKNALLSLSCIIYFFIPNILEKLLKLKISDYLKITFAIFLYLSLIIGEVNSFYLKTKTTDVILHFTEGFMVTIIAFFLIDIINGKSFHKKIKKIFIMLFNIGFTLIISLLWELYEFGIDKIRYKDYQKNDIIETIVISELDKNGSTYTKKIHINSILINGEDWMKKYGGYIDIGLNDTIKDLFICMIGSIIANYLIYLKLKNKSKLIDYFYIKKSSQ